MADTNRIIDNMKKEMEKAIEAGKEEFKGIRTGRANASLLSRVQVEYFGSFVPLQQLGSTTVADAQTLVINAYDSSSVNSIEKSLSTSNLGVTTSSEGQTIRVKIPPLTGERREEYSKLAKVKAEDIRVSVRNHRHKAKQEVASLKKAKEISDDDERGIGKKIDTATKEFTDKVDEILKLKLEELSSF